LRHGSMVTKSASSSATRSAGLRVVLIISVAADALMGLQQASRMECGSQASWRHFAHKYASDRTSKCFMRGCQPHHGIDAQQSPQAPSHVFQRCLAWSSTSNHLLCRQMLSWHHIQHFRQWFPHIWPVHCRSSIGASHPQNPPSGKAPTKRAIGIKHDVGLSIIVTAAPTKMKRPWSLTVMSYSLSGPSQPESRLLP
jgi:hypothetical protein